MKLSDIFEAQGDHKQVIFDHGELGKPETELLFKMLKEHCSDALEHFDKPIWRGMNGSADVYMIDVGNTERKSKNTTNYYTIIMDHFLPMKGYPKRSKSIICGNNPNRGYASSFGSAYAIFPYNGVKIGVCVANDLWNTPEFPIGDSKPRDIDQWNRFFDYGAGVELDASSYENFVKSIVDNLGKGNEYLEDVFGSDPTVAGVNKLLQDAYSPSSLHLNKATSEDINIYDDKRREVWVGGPCIAISLNVYHDLLEKRENED